MSYVEALVQLNELDKAKERALALREEAKTIPSHVRDLNSECLKRLKKIVSDHHW